MIVIRTSAVVAIIGLLAMAQPAWAEIGRIKNSVGSTAIQRGPSRLALGPGFKVEPGDVLITGKDGRISVTFVDNSRFAVGPNSRVALTKFQYDAARQSGSFVTQVDRGSLAVVSGQIAHSTRDAMKVRTPTSLLGVRGTRFVVRVP